MWKSLLLLKLQPIEFPYITIKDCLVLTVNQIRKKLITVKKSSATICSNGLFCGYVGLA